MSPTLACAITVNTDEPAEPAARWLFTEKQVDVYGEYELQVLEDLLRSTDLPGEQKTAALGASAEWKLSRYLGLRLRGTFIDQDDDRPDRDRSVSTGYLGMLWYPKGRAAR